MSRSRTARRARRAALVAPILVPAVLLAGCGGPDSATPRPGLAAEVDGTSISLSEVDDATTQFCDDAAADAADSGDAEQPQTTAVLPRVFKRQEVAATFVVQIALERLLDERGLSLGDSYGAAVDQIEQDLAGRSDVEGLEQLRTAQAYIDAAAASVGAEESGAQSSPDGTVPQEVTSLGYAAAFRWLAEHDVVVNPVLDFEITDDGLRATNGSDLSVAVSDRAKAQTFDPDDPGTIQRAVEAAADLPADQTCVA